MIAYAVTPPAVPMMSADWLLLTVLVETGKLALVAPPGTVTLGGTVASVVLSLDKATEKPPAPAGAVSVTVPVAGSPATTSVGLTFTVDSAGAASAGAARTWSTGSCAWRISSASGARRGAAAARRGTASWGHTQPYVERVSGRGEAGVLADVWLTTAADDVQAPRTQDASLSLRSCFGGKTAAPPSLSSSMRLGTPGILGDAVRWAIAFA